jgi:hypothetical protein
MFTKGELVLIAVALLLFAVWLLLLYSGLADL